MRKTNYSIKLSTDTTTDSSKQTIIILDEQQNTARSCAKAQEIFQAEQMKRNETRNPQKHRL